MTTFELQFLKYNNHKKSRLTDLFRKMDKNNDGLIPRDEFIQGIINTSKFLAAVKNLLLKKLLMLQFPDIHVNL